MFSHQISVLDLNRYLQAAGSMLSSTVSFSFFSSMLTNSWTTACTVVLMIIFSTSGQVFFEGQSSVSFIGAVIRLLDSLQNDFFENVVYYWIFCSGGLSRLLKLILI